MKPQEKIPYNDRLEEMKQEEKLPFFATHRGKAVSALIMLVIILAIIALQMGNSGSIAYEMDDVQMAVVCMDRGATFIPYEDITQVELISSFNMGAFIESQEWDSGWCGTYENEDYGEYTLYAYSETGSYIVVHHKNGVLIFNDKTEKSTDKAYRELLERSGRG